MILKVKLNKCMKEQVFLHIPQRVRPRNSKNILVKTAIEMLFAS